MWLGRLQVAADGSAPGPADTGAGAAAAGIRAGATRALAGAVPADPGPMDTGVAEASPAVIDAGEAEAGLELSLAPGQLAPVGQTAVTVGAGPGPLAAGPVSQLAAGMAAALHLRAEGSTEIALAPAELGGVRLTLKVDARDQDRIVIHLAFDRPETMDLFRRHADQLAEAIRSAGYAETRLDFGQPGTGPWTGGGEGTAEGVGGRADEPAANASTEAVVPDRTLPLMAGETAGLDLRL